MPETLSKKLIAALTRILRTDDEKALDQWIADPRRLNQACDSGNTSLLHAASWGARKCLAKLIPLSEPGALNKQEESALFMAARNGHAACVRLLLPVSNARIGDYYGVTPLMMAAAEGHEECALALIPASDLRQASQAGDTALIAAATSRYATLIEALLPGSDPCATDHLGQTALHVAASFESIKVVRPLANACPLNARAGNGMTAEDIAREQGNEEIAEFLASLRLAQEEKALLESSILSPGPVGSKPRI